MDKTVVDVESGWWSKINWAQVIGIVASLLVIFTGGKIDLTPEQQAAIVVMIQAVQSGVTVIFRTFFTTSVTPSSIK